MASAYSSFAKGTIPYCFFGMSIPLIAPLTPATFSAAWKVVACWKGTSLSAVPSSSRPLSFIAPERSSTGVRARPG